MKRRTMCLETLAEVMPDVECLLQDGYDRVGNWSLGQACNHLAAGIDMTLNSGLPPFLQRFGIFCFFRLQFLGKLGRVLRMRMPTSLPQTLHVDDGIGVTRLRTEIARLSDAAIAHLTRFHLWHIGHHLSFLIPKSAESA